MNNAELYRTITERIITNLETAGSWMKLWQVPSPISLHGHYYRGINRMVLSSDPYKSRVYGTFKQIRENGGQVRKGEHATLIVFWKRSTSKDRVTKEEKSLFLLRYFYIFNTEQADFDEIGMQKIEKLNLLVSEKVNAEHQDAQAIVDGYKHRPEIIFSDKDDRAFYSPMADMISVPDKRFFDTTTAFYATLFHEMGHSTGHPKRLNRIEGMSNRFGDIPYSKEELVAELCSSFLCGIAGLGSDVRNSTAYIKSWTSALRDNEKWIMWASSKAEKAADHILGIEKQYDEPEHTDKEVIITETPVLQS